MGYPSSQDTVGRMSPVCGALCVADAMTFGTGDGAPRTAEWFA